MELEKVSRDLCFSFSLFELHGSSQETLCLPGWASDGAGVLIHSPGLTVAFIV